MTSTSYKYPKSTWDPRILDYIGLKKNETYYKNYIYKCLITKLQGNYRYGRYELDEELINIFRDSSAIYSQNSYYYKYSSKSSLNYLLDSLRNKSTYVNPDIFIISFDENGESFDDIEL